MAERLLIIYFKGQMSEREGIEMLLHYKSEQAFFEVVTINRQPFIFVFHK